MTDASTIIDDFCGACRRVVLDEVRHILRSHRWDDEELDELVLEYPLRPAKGLRPSLCIAAARALGVTEDAVITSATIVELLHNAFLIHDDVEDESLFRRGELTLQRMHGLPIAVNVADAMYALSLVALLDNLEVVGLRASLAIFRTVVRMLWETVGGQALELRWIRDNTWAFWNFREAYEELVTRKTAVYSFITPVEIACVLGHAPDPVREQLVAFARHAGIAFQIVDDLLNLDDNNSEYGKEALGDLWEGKRTLILMHALASERDPDALHDAIAILGRRRPSVDENRLALDDAAAVLDALHTSGHVDAEARIAMLAALRKVGRARGGLEVKTESDVQRIKTLIDRHGSRAFARDVARQHAAHAARALDGCSQHLARGDARSFLLALPAFVLERLR